MTNENPKTLQETVIFVDDDKNTNLHYIAACGNLEKVIQEIDGGCVVDSANFLGWTPLMMATRNGHFEVVQYLIEKRADSTTENKFGYNILLVAVASGELKVLHVILQHLLCGGVSRRSLQKKFSPMSLAVLFGYQHVVEYLIQHSFCVNSVGVNTVIESTPLVFASNMGNVELAQFLISKGAKSTSNKKSQDNKQHGKPPVSEVSPLILVTSPQINSPSFNPQLMEMPRRCSDLNTPFFTPHISPFQLNPFGQQVFFPPNFSPNHFIAPHNPVPYFRHSNDFLNIRLIQSSPYYSPVTPVYISPFNMA